MKKFSTKIMATVMLAVMIISTIPLQVFANEIRVSVNGQVIEFAEPVRTASDILLAPMRPLADAIGAELRWNGETRTATIILGNVGAAVAMDNTVMVVRNMTTGAEERVTLPVSGRVYGSTSFIPVEAVTRALGLNIRWSASTQTWQITTPGFVASTEAVVATPTPVPTQPQAPIQLQNVLGRDYEAFRLTSVTAFTREAMGSMMGAQYEYGFMLNGPWTNGSAFFNVGGRYVSMSGFFGPMDNVGTTGGRATTLYIVGDGRTLDSFEMNSTDPIRQFTVNVTGVSQVEFRFSGSNGRYGVSNVTLAATGTAQTRREVPTGNFENTAILGNQIRAFRLNSVNAFSLGQMGAMMGVQHEHGFALNGPWTNGSAFFNINGRYTNLSATYGPLDNVGTTGGRSTTLHILGDGRLIESFEMTSTDPVRQLSVDVTGVSQVEFRFEGSNGRFGVANATVR